jgi:hypothetical protein
LTWKNKLVLFLKTEKITVKDLETILKRYLVFLIYNKSDRREKEQKKSYSPELEAWLKW